MSDKQWSLKEKDVQLLSAMGTIDKQDIAKKLNCNRTTLWHWEKDAEIKAAVDRIKQESLYCVFIAKT